jgi:hypothetical protein
VRSAAGQTWFECRSERLWPTASGREYHPRIRHLAFRLARDTLRLRPVASDRRHLDPIVRCRPFSSTHRYSRSDRSR